MRVGLRAGEYLARGRRVADPSQRTRPHGEHVREVRRSEGAGTLVVTCERAIGALDILVGGDEPHHVVRRFRRPERAKLRARLSKKGDLVADRALELVEVDRASSEPQSRACRRRRRETQRAGLAEIGFEVVEQQLDLVGRLTGVVGSDLNRALGLVLEGVASCTPHELRLRR